jgi:hypothetical protein
MRREWTTTALNRREMLKRGGATSPDSYLVSGHLPDEPLNLAGVNDPKLSEITSPSAKVIGGWEPYVKNFMPNIGNDYGGRLMAAWLDR